MSTDFLDQQINEASLIIPTPTRSEEEEEDEQIRAMAASFAPEVEELDALLASPGLDLAAHLERIRMQEAQTPTIGKKLQYTELDYDSDNSVDAELDNLGANEELLRQELQFAQDFGVMMNSPELVTTPGGVDPPELLMDMRRASGSLLDTKESYEDSTSVDDDLVYETPKKGKRPQQEPPEVEEEEEEEEAQSPLSLTRHNYTLSDHSHYLQIQTESKGGWYFMPLLDLDVTVQEYIIPLAEKDLDRLYVGIQEVEDTAPLRLPVRSIGIKIRPDVLVGAVMDAVMHGLEDYGEVQKRQGGHLVITNPELDFDFQLVSYKGAGSRFCERILLMRIFHNADTAASPPPEPDATLANWRLKEAAALVQKMETSRQGASEKFFGSSFWGKKPVYKTKKAMQGAIARQLLDKYKPCQSVQGGNLTLPALSKLDWPWIQHSWTYIEAVWDELQDRDVTYSSLHGAPFGQFPALTTLDVHYCSQLRRLSRENMVLSLLRSASELEQFARESEYACANLIQVLKPCVELYDCEPPTLPQPLPLTAYPLDYTPHQELCPPWGQKVLEAMNEVTAISSDSDGDQSYNRAERAVQLVLDAFQRQHDEEQSARLGRKNLQVMDRLAKMQAHKQASIEIMQASYPTSKYAQTAAAEFHKFAKKACSDMPETEQVPLFKCSILVGSSTGSVYITATQLMCVTQLIPLVGGNKVLLLDLEGLEFCALEASSSLLNPLPAGISVRRGGEECVMFRPSYPAARLKVFLEIVQAQESRPPEQKMGGKEGILKHMYGDGGIEGRTPEEDGKEASS